MEAAESSANAAATPKAPKAADHAAASEDVFREIEDGIFQVVEKGATSGPGKV